MRRGQRGLIFDVEGRDRAVPALLPGDLPAILELWRWSAAGARLCPAGGDSSGSGST